MPGLTEMRPDLTRAGRVDAWEEGRTRPVKAEFNAA